MKATLVLFQMVTHPLFASIDVNRAIGMFVVIDPIDRGHILYLSEQAYNKLVNVTLTQSVRLVVLARPEDDVSRLVDEVKSRKT